MLKAGLEVSFSDTLEHGGRIRNAIICHLAVMIVPSMPCSTITAAVCRPRPRVTEYDTSAVAMMLRA